MLKIATMPILMRMASKIDMIPVIERLKKLDIIKDGQKVESDPAKRLTQEQLGVLAAEVMAEIIKQLDRIADDLPELVASYKGLTVEQANECDALEVIDEIIHDKGIRGFFSRALRPNAEPKS